MLMNCSSSSLSLQVSSRSPRRRIERIHEAAGRVSSADFDFIGKAAPLGQLNEEAPLSSSSESFVGGPGDAPKEIGKEVKTRVDRGAFFRGSRKLNGS